MAHRWRLLTCALVLGLGGLAQASQDPELAFTDPRAVAPAVTADLQAYGYPARSVEDQDTDLSLFAAQAAVRAAFPVGARDEGSVRLSALREDLATDARLPDVGAALPGELWDLRFTAGVRHFFDGGQVLGGSMGVASPSDKPFHSSREVVPSATASLRLPAGERDAWFFLLHYSQNRDFWNGIPIPGVAYLHQPSAESSIVLGFPFAVARTKLADLGLSASYVFPRTGNLRLTYALPHGIEALAAFVAENERFLRADREERKDRLSYSEHRVEAGLRLRRGTATAGLVGGYAFHRYYFEGRDFQERSQNRINVDPGLYLRAEAGLRF